ncbi:UDP-N-acetylmuramate--alanine ligase [Candidatus Endolissoclinum faulkneri L5]|uniref:UDP-N-acetylmuramate--L-alanine ligase n=1 Tax=Candidatus Endolissoclinum faulkneri L5 TaxID=1401328 RepID=V9TUN4_9PROT|nr:UDP-N-acetylmuramate--L-alanine ligase [Candidatus Endolissoclinum faulkneri]AHC73862.1 UDP-N-acetylmuramate--alanine ligase [Candidatus Endolissoclinum faulkneri L5]
MNTIPFTIGIIHFIGIGGIGMSSIAEILHSLSYQVQGSDIVENTNTKRLEQLGIGIFIGHSANNIIDASVVVISTAIKLDNPELIAARERIIPVVHRADMLKELMRLKRSIVIAGTHGKTTTTSIVSAVLNSGGIDPTVINGGIINAYGTNAHLGKSEWIVLESDESDGSFTKLHATIAIITSIDHEHLDFHGSLDNLKQAFEIFVLNTSFYGFVVLCLDHKAVKSIISQVSDRRIITYGFSAQADIRAVDVNTTSNGVNFTAVITDRTHRQTRSIDNIFFPMYGRHNIQNALASIAIAANLGIDDSQVRNALKKFTGVQRRFTTRGESAGIKVIDDYAHHPAEIAALLSAVRDITRKNQIIAVVQPHRYTRLRDLFEDFCSCFNEADAVIVSEVYAAGETSITGISRDDLVSGIRAHGHRKVIALINPIELAGMIVNLCEKGDIVVCLGAGSVTEWAQALPAQIDHIISRNASQKLATV